MSPLAHGIWNIGIRKKLFESFAKPAKATYHASNAASSAKNPPAMITGLLGSAVPLRCKYPIPSRRKAMSTARKVPQKTKVDFSVHRNIMKVKINQPC